MWHQPAPRGVIGENTDLESMRTVIRDQLSAETHLLGLQLLEHSCRQVYKVFAGNVLTERGWKGYHIVLECVDEFVDYQTAELNTVYNRGDHECSKQGRSFTVSLEFCECVIKTWNVVNERLARALTCTW